ncbi:glycosyltransferase family 2 protein [Ktedonosporobacter rubrisoli]|uniref:Glycosyltransferase family 2 protein n=1 Tax=Ktedonosporobacter rubrisoli TaxID=2509675 RepID=A0A4P6JRN3_KTERU|nr:glycosyltransferase [Ktedonosporobacter rubrisoli]QBD77973.1 glycosyltransferase family 2 protein [Ktedonosporobacter rubrisoli]
MTRAKTHPIAKIALYILLYGVTISLFASTLLFKGHQLQSPHVTMIRAIVVLLALIMLAKHTFYLSLCPWFDIIQIRRRKLGLVKGRYEPLVSVIIPAWNEEVGLLSTVKTLLESTYQNIEIVVINDGSTDGSDRIMQRFVARYCSTMISTPNAPRLIYYYKENGGKGSALNAGIRLSHGDIILSIDADCMVSPDAIAHFVVHFADPEVMAAVGNVKIGNTRTLIGSIQHLEYLFSFYFKKADSILNTIYIIGGAAGAFRREVFERIGMYSTTSITEDLDLSMRIQKAGMRIVYASDAIIFTEGASDLAGLIRQRLRWKRGRFETFRAHRSLFFSTNKRHNKLLTWIILPLAIFGDLQLGFEPSFIAVLYFFSLLTQDFSVFIAGVVIVVMIFLIQLADDQQYRSLPFLTFIPIGWLLFYLTTVVEIYALLRSCWDLLHRHQPRWQHWKRTGTFS